MEFFATIRKQITEFFGKMEKAQVVRLGVLLALVVAVAITAVALLSRKNYQPLPVSGDAAKMGEVIARLDEMETAYKILPNGTITVPEEQVNSLTWQLASEGLFNNDFNYEWIALGTGFSSTESTQAAYSNIQDQENLRRVINGFNKIADSKVLLRQVKESPFVYNGTREQSSASVFIQLVDANNPLTAQEAVALRSLVKMAGNFEDDRITLVDNNFNYYDENVSAQDTEIPMGDRLALQYRIQDDMSRSLTKFLEPVFGIGGVEVRVSAELNFDKETVQSIVFAPPVEGSEEGLPIALKELSETIQSGVSVVQGEPGLDENGGAPSYIEDTAAGNDQVYSKISREVNMEINETKTLVEKAEGELTNLSVAVLVALNEEAEDYTEIIRALVAGAAGVRVEAVTVARLPMIDANADLMAVYNEINSQAEQYRLTRLIIIIASIVLVVVLLLIALRTILKALRPAPAAAEEIVPNEYAIDMVVGEGSDVPATAEDSPLLQLQRFIERDAESVAQLLRNWLSDDYR